MDLNIIKNLEDLKKYKNIIIQNENLLDPTNNYSFFKTLITTFKEKKVLIFIIYDRNNFLCLPLSSFKYFGLEFYTFIAGPDLSYERTLFHNIKDNNLLIFYINQILKYADKNRIKLFLNNISKQAKIFISTNIYFLSKYSMNRCLLNSNTIFSSKELETKQIKKIDFKLRKFTRFAKINFEDLKFSTINETVFNINDIINFIDNNKIISSKEKIKLINNLKIFFNLKNLEISILHFKNLIFSVIIGFNINKNFLFFSPVFNQNYKKFSFGFYHLFLLMNKKKLQGYKYFDLGPGNEEYKNNFNLYEDNFYSFTNSKLLKITIFFKNLIK